VVSGQFRSPGAWRRRRDARHGSRAAGAGRQTPMDRHDLVATLDRAAGKRVIISVRSTDVPLMGPFWGKRWQPRH